ncbi:NupC/NupG family nucleoside CNT transporter [Tunturiibacter gelidoferens]|uniref:Nucleoside transporter C-terminal domain-containing protein n=2 Tax=Tunturiibacter gelidiferens TaxID=3069689 RepID=A0AAU7YYY4_9BACT|nr:nucleoside transporter C-terminal domain-containing protein [Edaphobacter lichenicola]MBB5338099.1 CNT family concentrative nucleoside transporter [Edaphobacter lichenicola]
MSRFTGLLGLITFLGLAYAFSTNRRAIRWRTVVWGLSLQIVFAFLVIKWNAGQAILRNISNVITSLLAHSVDGSSLVFGQLGIPGRPFAVLAFAVLPTIIFVSAFFAIMYHIGLMQHIIRIVAWIMQRTMGTSGAESTNVAASIFMGQTEAPLTIRPFLAGATRSELMVIMTSGMAHVSGGIMAAYISFGINAQDLLSAVIMTAPGTILVAKMLVPETEVPATIGTVHMPPNEEHKNENFIAAVARGTIDGGRLAFNVAIMLISFVALVGLFNAIMLGISNFLWAHGHIPFPHSLNAILGVAGAPIAWLIGVPWHDAHTIGNLLGTRTMINEFVAFTQLGAIKSTLAPRTFSIATFALCGFANVGSIGMQIGGIGALVPNRRNDLAQLGLRAMLAGTMANLMSASIVSMLIK